MSFGVSIIDSTLREGEQFENSDFSTEDKLEIATALDAFGVEYLEVTSPVASPRSRRDCALLASHGLRGRILVHTRCHPDDVRVALDCGVHGINLVMAASPILRAVSHGQGVAEIVRRATTVAELIRARAPGLELRFSTEDAFRCPHDELLAIHRPLAASGLFDRFGFADTTGYATPAAVGALIGDLARTLGTDIEFHGHNDCGFAVANAFCAVEAGATHIDTCVLGIGERNGITPLEGLVAALYARDPQAIRERYRLHLLPELCALVAGKVGVEVPFSHPIVGASAFTHKAGLHAKAVMADPHSYEVLDPADFGRERRVLVAHRLTGWNAVRQRALALGLEITDDQAKAAAAAIKAAADGGELSMGEVDGMIAQAAFGGGDEPAFGGGDAPPSSETTVS